MKDHELAQLVNGITDTAHKFHNTQQLRERISRLIVPVITTANERIKELEADLKTAFDASWKARVKVTELETAHAAASAVSDKLLEALQYVESYLEDAIDTENQSKLLMRAGPLHGDVCKFLAEVSAIREHHHLAVTNTPANADPS